MRTDDPVQDSNRKIRFGPSRSTAGATRLSKLAAAPDRIKSSPTHLPLPPQVSAPRAASPLFMYRPAVVHRAEEGELDQQHGKLEKQPNHGNLSFSFFRQQLLCPPRVSKPRLFQKFGLFFFLQGCRVNTQRFVKSYRERFRRAVELTTCRSHSFEIGKKNNSNAQNEVQTIISHAIQGSGSSPLPLSLQRRRRLKYYPFLLDWV